MYKEITNENLLYSSGNSTLCGDLEGKKNEKREGICIRVADAVCCTVETNTTSQSHYTPIIFFLQKEQHIELRLPMMGTYQ